MAKLSSLLIATGCFDIIHPGHIRFLKVFKESQYTNKIIFINDDEYIIKNKNRNPAFELLDRKLIVSEILNDKNSQILSLSNDDFLLSMIKSYSYSHRIVRMVGDDYPIDEIVGKEYCDEIRIIKRDKHSTSGIVQKILGNNT